MYNQSFDFERLLATRPDLLILAKWQLEGFANYLPVLQQLSIPYVVVDFNQGEDAKLTSIRVMGQALGHGERAERLAIAYQQGIADIRRRITQANLPSPKTYIELGDKGPGEYSSSYGSSIWGALASTGRSQQYRDRRGHHAFPTARRVCVISETRGNFSGGRRLAENAECGVDGVWCQT